MNLTQLSEILEKLYNKLGNRYLTRNFITEPFEFKVKIKYDRDNEIHDYIIEVYSNPPMPNTLEYRPEVRKEQNKTASGVHISVIKGEFKKMYHSIETNEYRKLFAGVVFKS